MSAILRNAWRGFDFRVTRLSMVALFAITMAYVIGLRYMASFVDMERFFAWLVPHLGPGWTIVVIFVGRALETLLFVVLPFRSHLRENPFLCYVTVGVSFVGSILPWLLYWGLPWQGFVGLCIVYALVLGISWYIVYKDTPVQSPSASAPA